MLPITMLPVSNFAIIGNWNWPFDIDISPILHSRSRFARLDLANAKGRDMAKRKIQELTTGVVVETDKE